MEQGSPENPPSSEQRRITEDLEIQPSSYLALLMGLQNPAEAQQIGTSFPTALIPFGNSNLDTHHAYSIPNETMLDTSISLSAVNVPSGVSSSAQLPLVPKPMRRMINEADIGLTYPGNWISLVRGDQGYLSTNLSISGQGYTLYDQRYQAIGLPVDPHLRIFNAMNENVRGGSSSKNN